ncbi:MAG: type I-E CRISPR-associated protein Cas5/CasD [Chloroflexi bacterium]|nr:type I-E CRISPR-associated protein Cas5/CasD [Chloroflexota bacterium]
MSTLLLRLAGPMQSWGTQSRFTRRDTGAEPSKSGVIGLLCAALGKLREERPGDGWPELRELASLRMGVRVDRPGTLAMDYHTAGGTHRRGDVYGVATIGDKELRTVPSRRYYLADADFLVGLESEREDLLHRLDAALARPRWPLSLGRKAFVPGVPVRLPDEPPLGPGVRPLSLEEALASYPWTLGDDDALPLLRLVLDATPETADAVRRDWPLSFDARDFALRYVRFAQTPRPEVV